MKALLARGADVNARERRGQSALMWAAAEGHVEVVRALLGSGADFRTPLPSGYTPLFFAGTRIAEFSPTLELQRTMDVVRRNLSSMEEA